MGVVALVVVIVGGSGAAWAIRSSLRSGPPPTIAIQSPVATTLSWFAAVNDQDMPLALAHFVPADREMMEWSSWGPPFVHLHCSLQSKVATNAVVYCTFKVINDFDMSNVSTWDVYLQREFSGRWLINNYGQG
jgi:hypothetical protein